MSGSGMNDEWVGGVIIGRRLILVLSAAYNEPVVVVLCPSPAYRRRHPSSASTNCLLPSPFKCCQHQFIHSAFNSYVILLFYSYIVLECKRLIWRRSEPRIEHNFGRNPIYRYRYRLDCAQKRSPKGSSITAELQYDHLPEFPIAMDHLVSNRCTLPTDIFRDRSWNLATHSGYPASFYSKLRSDQPISRHSSVDCKFINVLQKTYIAVTLMVFLMRFSVIR